jgi:hypothetical protein
MEQLVKITIAKDGTVTIDVEGMVGTACKGITEALARRLGTEIESHEKPEYWQEVDGLQQKLFGN